MSVTNFDTWLDNQTRKYYGGCEPEIYDSHIDEDGETVNVYKCEECNNKECEYWEVYNDR